MSFNNNALNLLLLVNDKSFGQNILGIYSLKVLCLHLEVLKLDTALLESVCLCCVILHNVGHILTEKVQL